MAPPEACSRIRVMPSVPLSLRCRERPHIIRQEDDERAGLRGRAAVRPRQPLLFDMGSHWPAPVCGYVDLRTAGSAASTAFSAVAFRQCGCPKPLALVPGI